MGEGGCLEWQPGSSQGRQKGSPGPKLTCLSSRGQNSQAQRRSAQRATWLCMSVIYLPPAPTVPHTCTAVCFQYPKGDRFSSQHSLSKCTCHVLCAKSKHHTCSRSVRLSSSSIDRKNTYAKSNKKPKQINGHCPSPLRP